jgi:CheY-like chemotaxis protein
MRGEVGFHSVSGEGSQFWIDLPAHAAEPAAAAPAAREARRSVAPAGRRLVLYVEDNPANVSFMSDLVSSFENIDLITAPTAELGVELARARRPEVVIMDINLPGMSGLDALRALRAAPETSRTPVIALTAAASDRDRERGEQAGFYRYLTKPLRVDALEAALEELLVSSR